MDYILLSQQDNEQLEAMQQGSIQARATYNKSVDGWILPMAIRSDPNYSEEIRNFLLTKTIISYENINFDMGDIDM